MPDDIDLKTISRRAAYAVDELIPIYRQMDKELAYYKNVMKNPDTKKWPDDRTYLKKYLREQADKLYRLEREI